RSVASDTSIGRWTSTSARALQDEARQVLILENRRQPLAYHRRVHDDLLAAELRRVERHLVEQPLQHRVQPARADVLGALVHLGGDASDLRDGVVAEDQADARGREEGRVLAGGGVLVLRPGG